MLTREQWMEVKPPIYWLEIEIPSTWSSIHRDMVTKWLDHNSHGWWYVDERGSGRSVYAFEREEDRMLFKIWVTPDPFDSTAGNIEAA